MKRLFKKIILTALLMVLVVSCSPKVTPAPEVVMTEEPTPVATAEPTEEATAIVVPPAVDGEVLYIPFPLALTVDGDLSDWEGIPAYQVETGAYLSADPAENGSFTFSLAANEKTLYITMQMPDKNIVAGQHGTDFWNEDSMEFYINATDNLNATRYDIGMFQVNINATNIGNTDPKALTISGVFSSDAKLEAFVFKTDDGWGFEAAVDIEGLIDVTHGTEIGFQAQINGATVKDRDVKLIWSKYDTSDQSWEYPYMFGRALFFELGQTDVPQASAVVLPTGATPEEVVIPPLISVNQQGYLPGGVKVAVLALSAADAIPWQLVDSTGVELAAGVTEVKGLDELSGDNIHLIDFSMVTTPQNDVKLVAGELESVAFDISDEVYAQLRLDSLAYFYANRTGIAIDAAYVGEAWARPAGHVSDAEITCFSGVDATGKEWDGCDYTLDLSKGWYDAGDFGKYVVNGGITVWTMLNLYEQYPDLYADGSLAIPEAQNGVSDLLDEARWEMEFLLAMQVPQGEALAGMVHHKMHDEAWAPLPMVPPTEVDNDPENLVVNTGRYVYPPSTAATLNLAATAAQCARLWQGIDDVFAGRCLLAAEAAWDAAVANPAVIAGNMPGNGGGNYDDATVTDEFYWAAAELYRTTGAAAYLDYLTASELLGTAKSFDWGNTATLGTLSLLMAKDTLPDDVMDQLSQGVLAYADDLLAAQSKPGYFALINADYPWGSNSTILNNMILMAQAYKLGGDRAYYDAVVLSMDYVLGRNTLNQSFVAGYGTYPPLHPHHRFWANKPAGGYPPPLAGAVVGGVNFAPTDAPALDAGLLEVPPAKRYIDDVESYSTNEVAINWNAPLAWIAAFLDVTLP